MEIILEGIKQAFLLLVTFDREVMSITFLSLKISLTATAVSMVIGTSIAVAVAMNEFPGKSIVVSLINTGMALPPVVVGLLVSLMLWRSGPLGMFGLLYSPLAIVIAQIVIGTPLVAGIGFAALQQLPKKLKLQIMALGATRFQTVWLLLKETRLLLLAAVMAGFGSVISEVGASIMVGGNIKGHTRVLTTATVMETSKGNFDIALSLGFILLFITFLINFMLTRIQQRNRQR